MLFRRVDVARLDGIRQVGTDLATAITNITLVNGTNGPVANYPLFNALLANYRAKASVFKQQLAAKETEFKLSISQDLSRREPLRKLDLWGGATQSTTFVSPISSIPPRARDQTQEV